MEVNSTGLTNGVIEAPPGGDNQTVTPSSGVHHHLPQIPTMDKGLKKAYSKTKQQSGGESVVVTHVEGTGAVLKISETNMDVDSLLDKMEESDKNLNGDDKIADKPEATETGKAEREKTSADKCTKRGRKSKDRKQTIAEPVKSENVSPEKQDAEQRTKRIVKRKLPKTEFQETETSPKDVKTKMASPFVISPEMESQKPPKYEMGDMLWAKVGGHPWWPCMVSECPYTQLYTKIQGGLRIQRMYHIQYFGNEGERGWINETSSLVFKGLNQFLEYSAEQIKAATKSSRDKIVKMYRVMPSRKIAWDIGVAQATDAFKLDCKDRQDKYTFTYNLKDNKLPEHQDPSKDTPTKKRGRKRKMDGDSPSSVEDTPVETVAKRQKTEDTESHSSLVKALFTRPKTAKYEVSFDTFYHKHEEAVLDDHPDWSGEEVKEHLGQQWSLMSEKQKARYRTKFSLESDVSNAGKRSPRVSKPSIKKLEAEEDKRGQITTTTTTTTPKATRKSRRTSELRSDEEKDVTMETESAVETLISAETDKKPSEKKSEKKIPEKKPDRKEIANAAKKNALKSRRCEPVTTTNVVLTTEVSPVTIETVTPAVEEKKKTRKNNKSLPLPTAPSHDSDSGSDKSEPRNDLKSRVVQSTIKSGDDEYELDIFKLHATSCAKRENICIICEQPGQLMECQGACQGHFHASCLQINGSPETNFKCNQCQTGNHTCFGCKETSEDTRKCSVSSCGKFYHEQCFKKFPQSRIEGKSYFCPLHTCATCAAENPRSPKATKGRLLRCVRCPVAYHAGDYCIAAGAMNLAGNYIVCSKHFQPNKTHRHHSHVNVSWCFQCSKGGTLLCCESCPAAYHSDCLKMTFPDGSWYCSECSSGKKPLYGDLIWIKIGSYRWWPGEICHPRNVPLNIQEKHHQVGEFPVRFFGSHDFYWTHQGRVFLFQEGDKGSRDTATAKGLAKIFSRGVVEATEAFKIWQAAKANKEQLEKENNAKKPAPYKYVKTNVPIGNVQINKADLSEIPRCECRQDQENPCSSDSDCLNRMLMYECHPQACPAAEKCQNQRFQKREYPTSEPIKTPSRGWGLYTKVDVKKGQFVNEYVGDLVDEDECRRRIKQAHEDNITNFYMLTLDKNRVIDAGPKGNLSRFMNHCCQPNCETQKWMVNGDVRVGLFALVDIPAGSELTFNYNLECLGNEKTICACGASNCSGFLGVRPKSAAAIANANRMKDAALKKKKKKKKIDIKKEHDDDCFRCEEGGELVMCDHSSCPKVYHLQCLNLTRPPTGKWLCPWHHCDTCGKASIKLCSKCPNSYCAKHIKGNIFDVEGTLYCSDHDNILSTFAPSKIKTPPRKVKEESSSGESSKASTPSPVQNDDSEEHNGSVECDASTNPINFKTVKKILTSGLNNSSENASSTPEPLFGYKSLPPGSSVEQKPTNRSPAVKPNLKGDATATVRQRGRPCKTKAKMIANMKQGSARLMESKGMTPPQNIAVDELKVAPMFDDSDEGETDLVIDIPQF